MSAIALHYPAATHRAPSARGCTVRAQAPDACAHVQLATPKVQRRAVVRGLLAIGGGMGPALLGGGTEAAHAANATGAGVDDDESPLIQELLARSRENKARYDKERLDDYNKRNFKDYFEFVVGVEGPDGPSESQKQMKAWLEANKDK